MSSRPIIQQATTQVHKISFCLVVLDGCGTWSPTLREEQKRRVFEHMPMRKAVRPNRRGGEGDEKILICTADRMWCNQTKNDEMGGASSTYGGQEKCTEFSLGNLKEGDHLKS